jgi:spermidine/putrescine transport system permease protein
VPEAKERPRHRPGRSREGTTARLGGVWYPRWFWPSFTVPGTVWLLFLFVLPFYVIVCVAFGTVDPIFRSPVPVWNPLRWDSGAVRYVLNQTFLRGGIYQPAFIRTFVYVGTALAFCLVIGYPVAYYLARYGGRWKTLFLVGLIAPFWISYLMRMLAWINLLQDDGLINKVLVDLHLLGAPRHWLEGESLTVILGLAYGYIPYMILPLFAALDRIDRSVLEAARDLGASPGRTFFQVTLPMFGDYYTADLLSGSPRTTMVGNLVDHAVNSPLVGRAAALVLVLMVLLVIPMLYYLYATSRASRQPAT